MRINAFGYILSLKSFIRICFWRLFCTHKKGEFHACTGAEKIGNGDNVNVGILFICHKCKRAWIGDIQACAPNK